MKRFQDTFACKSRAHCVTCRYREGGRAWREGLGAKWLMPDGAPDFECPFGVAWNISEAEAPPRPAQPRRPRKAQPKAIVPPAEAERILGQWFDARQACFGCPSKCKANLTQSGTCSYRRRAKAGIRPACPEGRF